MRTVLTALVVAVIAASCGSTTDTLVPVSSADSAAIATSSQVSSTTPTSTTTTSTTTTAAPTTVAPPTTSPPSIAECLAVIPVEVKVGQLLFPVVVQSELADAAELASRGAIAGVVVVGAVQSGVDAQIADIQARSLVAPSLIAVDEEGGRVQRLADLIGPLPSARTVAASGTPEEARRLAHDHAAKLAELGFTMNLAPVLDLDTGGYIRDRSFGADPEVVAEYGLAVAAGIGDAGVVPVVKHFPGHGRGTDSHRGLPVLPGQAELESTDIVPFRAAVEAGLPVMVGHLVVPDLTGSEPASLSAAAVAGWLRDGLGFDGLVMTDAFNMDAISATKSADVAAEAAVAAGVDLAMLGRLAEVGPATTRLVDAVSSGRLGGDAVDRAFLRVLEAKDISACDLPAEVAPAIRCDGVTDGGCALALG